MKKKNNIGFTIIELMIAMTILSFIALAIYQNTTQSFYLRDNLSTETDFYNSVRVALDVMTRDITHMYSPMANALPGELGKAMPPVNSQESQQKNSNTETKFNLKVEANRATDFWGEIINFQGVKPSRIQGESNKLSFVSLSHMRIYEDSPESEFSKITYKLEDNPEAEPLKNSAEKNQNLKMLIKLEDPDVFGDNPNSETETRYVLLPNVKSIEFKYLDGEKDRWESKWDNVQQADVNGNFPAIIQVTLEIFLPRSTNTFKVTEYFKAELPL